jgi:hypothetical protein
VSRLTAFLARLIGLFCVVLALAMAMHKQTSVATIDALVHSPDMLLIIGLVALGTGLALVLQHNIWSGGAATVVVTLIGWLLLVRAALLLFLPMETVASLIELIRFDDLFYVYMAIVAALGLFLTYAGFTAPPATAAATPASRP